MPDIRENILHESFVVKSEDGRTRREDIKAAIKKNPDIDRIYLAMDENGKQMSISFLKYVLEHKQGHSVDAAGNVEVKWNGEWLTPEALFENFL